MGSAIQDHHLGYISGSNYEDNLRQLQRNRTNLEISGIARKGNTLLQGLLICDKCGRYMFTIPIMVLLNLVCKQCWELGKACICSSIRAEPFDQAVDKRIMVILQPAELELALLSLDNLIGEDNTVKAIW